MQTDEPAQAQNTARQQQISNGGGTAEAMTAAVDDASYVPLDAGSRIPIPIRPLEADAGDAAAAQETAQQANGAGHAQAGKRTAANNGQAANGAATHTQSTGQSMPAMGYIPDVMAEDQPPQPQPTTTSPAESLQEALESVEERVQRLRPRSLRMQARFFRTLFFALWLFGRLTFWQLLVASYFPRWVNNRNTKRWRKYARQFRNFAIGMGGVMIKAGQFASTRADVLPEEVIKELSGLQDKVPTIGYSKIEKIIAQELGEINERFAWINPDPIAAASLGQVHRAKLRDGTQVVIKVQRPGIRDVIYTDMAALFIVARVAMRFRFVNRRADMVLLSEEFGRVLLEEVSYEKELSNGQRFGRMFADVEGVYVPETYPQHSTDLVLTMEDVTNIKLNDYAAMDAAGIDRKEVAKRMMDTYMVQIFEERFFHADLHPGNLFLRPLPVDDVSQYAGKGGRPFELIFIDFGMTGSLTREIRQGLIDTLAAVLTRDAKRLVASYKKLGFLLPNADTTRIEEATTLVFDQVWGMSMKDMSNIDFEVVSEIGREFTDLLFDMPFRVPQDFVYLGRSVAILTGICIALDPDYNPWNEIQYYTQQLITTEDDNLVDQLQKAFLEPILPYFTSGPQGLILLAQQLIKLAQTPQRTEKLLNQVIKGEVAIVSKPSVLYRRQLNRIEMQGRRTNRMFLFGSLLITATIFYTNGDTTLAMVGYSFSGVTLLALFFVKS
jgi:predicted unusual protein kinase regulating ubiquinone biosynthesis (AarF/ABC1/UbiB family)